MLGLVFDFAWKLIEFNNFQLPKLAWDGIQYLIGSGSSVIR